MNLAKYTIAALAVFTFAFSPVAQASEAKAETLSTEERLTNIEEKLDALIALVGDPSGRNNLAELVERLDRDTRKDLNSIKNDLKSVGNNVKRLKR